MATVTDYGLAFTEFAGVLLMLAFLRGVVLHARARFRPTPVVAPVRAPDWMRRRPAQPVSPAPTSATPLQSAGGNALVPIAGRASSGQPAAATPRGAVEILPPTPSVPSAPEGEAPLSSVIIETRSAHVEEAADGSRFAYWSLVRYRRDNAAGNA